MYYKGKGVEINYRQAIHFFNTASSFKENSLKAQLYATRAQSNLCIEYKSIGFCLFGNIYLIDEENQPKFVLRVVEPKYLKIKYSNFEKIVQKYYKCHHPTVLDLQGAGNQNYYYFVTEYLEKGSLNNYLGLENTQNTKIDLDLTQKLIIAFGVALGMMYLHNLGISHQDLRPSNILLDQNFYPKICNYGLLSLLSLYNQNYGKEYFAPEFFISEDYEKKDFIFNESKFDDITFHKQADVYSYGLILCCMFTNSKMSNQINDIRNRIFHQKNLPLSNVHPSIKLLIENCCNIEPQKRPTFINIIQSLKLIFK